MDMPKLFYILLISDEFSLQIEKVKQYFKQVDDLIIQIFGNFLQNLYKQRKER